MGGLTNTGKYFIIRNLHNGVNNTLTIINLDSSEALTASVTNIDTVHSKKWILSIASTISYGGVFSIVLEHDDSIISITPQVEVDEYNKLKVYFKIDHSIYTSNIEINKDYIINDISYYEFIDQFMTQGRVIDVNTPILCITYPKEKWSNDISESDKYTSISTKQSFDDSITVALNNSIE